MRSKQSVKSRRTFTRRQQNRPVANRINMTEQREQQANRLLNDPLYNEAFDQFSRKHIHNTWITHKCEKMFRKVQ